MNRFIKVMVITLVLGAILIGPGLGCATADKGTVQKLVAAGSWGERPPMLKGMFSLYFVNPHSAGDIIIDKILIIREDGALAAKVEDIETPKGQDNILEPYESWEFVAEEFADLPPDAKRTYSAWAYWHPAEGSDSQLAGWWYQKILFGPLPGTEGLPQLCLLQYPMVNVIE